MAAAPLLRPVTSTGVRLANVVVPFPNAPLLFLPQHFTPPAMVRAQVCWVPKETAVTPLVRPDTFTGVELLEVVPLPSEPTPLFDPQHLTPPPEVTAQVWPNPAATMVTSLLRPVSPLG